VLWTNHLHFNYFLWENSLWYTSVLDYEHFSRTDYARNPIYYICFVICPNISCCSPHVFHHTGITVSPGMEEMPSLNMLVERLKVATLPLDSPCSRPVIHLGEILTTGKSHRKKVDKLIQMMRIMSRDQNEGRSHSMKIDNSSIEREHLRTTFVITTYWSYELFY
jgi:hypothetical protein